MMGAYDMSIKGLQAQAVKITGDFNDRMQENIQLLKKIGDMEDLVNKLRDEPNFGKKDKEGFDKMKKDLTEYKSFNIIPILGGKEGVDWSDFEFKIQSFVRPLETFEKWLDWIKEQNEPISNINMNEYFGNNRITDMTPAWCDDQLYTILSLKCQGAELQVVRNLREYDGYRGANGWYKLTREVSQKSGARLDNLTELALNPKHIKNYSDAVSFIEKWENDCMELRKIEEQDLTDKTKKNVLKKMLPVELQRDIERDCTLQDYKQVYNYVIQQIPLRRDRQQASGKKKVEDDDLDDLDTQQAGEEGKEPEDQGQDDLDTIKGGGKGGFAGNCNYCGKYGHRKSECWTLTQALGKGKGADGEKGKGKGKDSGKNFGGKG